MTRPEAVGTLFGGAGGGVGVEVHGFDAPGLADHLRRNGVAVVLDATHPYATRITEVARAACEATGVAYLRYERPDWSPPAGVRLVDSFSEAAGALASFGERVLLTVGSRPLGHFAGLQDRLTLFARILPSPVSLTEAAAAGFTQDRVLGLRPPFSYEFNRAVLREYRIGVLVTKSSGVEGGVVEKVSAALDLGLAVLMVRRPVTAAGAPAVSNVPDAVAGCLTLARKARPAGPG